jgi:tetratricopeptide (TPR) repeat protein
MKSSLLAWPQLACALALSGCVSSGSAHGAVAMNKLSIAQLLSVASALEQSGDSVRAEQYLQQALKQGAPATSVVPSLLRLYVVDGQYRLAVDQAENYLRKHPRERAVRLLLGNLYDALGQEGDALRQYEQVLADAPRDAQAHFALASSLHDAGRERARADQHFRTYLELAPSGPHAEEARSLLLTQLAAPAETGGEAPEPATEIP